MNWSGREDLNLRPPGPETGNFGQVVDFSTHVSGASTVQTHVIPARRSHSFSYGCPGVGAPTLSIEVRGRGLCPVMSKDVEGTARTWKDREIIFSQFAGA